MEFCIEVLEDALARFGRPGFPASASTPSARALARAQGDQFTSPWFTGVQEAGIRISMNGRTPEEACGASGTEAERLAA